MQQLGLSFRNLLEKFLFFWVDSKIWVALCFAGLFHFLGIITHNINLNLYTELSFCVALGGYSLFTYEVKRYRVLKIIFIVLSFFITLHYSPFLHRPFLFIGLIFFSLLYQIPFTNWGLRNNPYTKLIHISLVWMLWLVVYFNGNSFSPQLIVSLFFFILGLTLPFDIKDMNDEQLLTIPKIIGITKTKYLSISFLVLSAILFPIFQEYSLCWYIACGLGIFLIACISSKKQRLYYDFLIEGISLVPILLVFLYTLL